MNKRLLKIIEKNKPKKFIPFSKEEIEFIREARKVGISYIQITKILIEAGFPERAHETIRRLCIKHKIQ